MNWIDRLDRLNEWIGRTVSWLTLAMVLVTFAVVVLRYWFQVGWIAMQESITYMHATLFMLGAAYTLRHGGHVRVDILYRKWSPQRQAWVDLLGTLLLLMPMSLFILWISWSYVASSWSLHEGSREAGGLDGVWLLKGIILLMPLLLALQGVVRLGQCWRVIRGLDDALDAPDMGDGTSGNTPSSAVKGG
ncbi:MAG: TRAP transporter small permease subunit [Magnetococcales bacterium]|nr:TRAP transporter small permease subunit [Magnetococcales bacterium]